MNDALQKVEQWARNHLIFNALEMYTGLLPTAMHNPADGITLTSDFAASVEGMPVGRGAQSLMFPTLKKFGHNPILTVNSSQDDIVMAALAVRKIIDDGAADRRHPDCRLSYRSYHMGALECRGRPPSMG